jgi:ADP-ribosyl-[dinitrogen reductase] hydrolase
MVTRKRVEKEAVANSRNDSSTTPQIESKSGPSALDRILGAMLGGAVGDALGAPIEFMSWEQIKRHHGDRGVRDYVASKTGRIGWITDDTQMSLFTAEGLIRAEVRGWNKGITNHTSCVSHSYLRWLKTQGIEPSFEIGTDGWLYGVRGLHEACAPGKTCISALQTLHSFTNERARNESKGCGGVMRVAPVGLFAHRAVESTSGREEIFKYGKECAWVTHGHPSGYLSGGAFALIIALLMNGDDLITAIQETLSILMKHDGHEETTKAISQALGLAVACNSDPHALTLLGGGWVAEEALAIAIYCALSYSDDFKEAVLLAVNHGGDSDSTGSMTGNLVGASLGIQSVPMGWLRNLELHDTIRKMAEDIHNMHHWDLEDEAVWERYPGW